MEIFQEWVWPCIYLNTLKGAEIIEHRGDTGMHAPHSLPSFFFDYVSTLNTKLSKFETIYTFGASKKQGTGYRPSQGWSNFSPFIPQKSKLKVSFENVPDERQKPQCSLKLIFFSCIPNSLTVLWTAVEMVDRTPRAPAMGKELTSSTGSVFPASGFSLPASEGRKLTPSLPRKRSCQLQWRKSTNIKCQPGAGLESGLFSYLLFRATRNK